MHCNSVITKGIDSTIESGYSVYVFNSNNPSDYCVFDEVLNFLCLRKLLCIAFGLLEISSVFFIPLLLVSIYDDFKEKMKNREKNLRYFVWATLVLIVLIIPLLITCNIFALINGFKTRSTHYNDIYAALSTMAFAMGFFPLICDTLTAILVVCRFKKIENSCRNINCFGFRNYTNTCLICGKNFLHCLICGKILLHFFAIVAVTWFTQLALFNAMYIFIGVIAAPVETGSLLLLYITSLFALISFFAVILKIFHKTLPARAPTDPIATPTNAQTNDPTPTFSSLEEQQPVNGIDDQPTIVQKNNNITGCVCYFILLIALVCVLAAGIGVFVSFMYIYIAMNQEYRNNRGILTFLGALLPSLLVSISGIFWTRIMQCIGKDNNDTEITRNHPPPTSTVPVSPPPTAPVSTPPTVPLPTRAPHRSVGETAGEAVSETLPLIPT